MLEQWVGKWLHRVPYDFEVRRYATAIRWATAGTVGGFIVGLCVGVQL